MCRTIQYCWAGHGAPMRTDRIDTDPSVIFSVKNRTASPLPAARSGLKFSGRLPITQTNRTCERLPIPRH